MRNILLTSSTGHQGQALITSLLRPPPPNPDPITSSTSFSSSHHEYHIFALTRSPTSPKAQTLLSSFTPKEKESITLIKGDLDDPASLRRVFEEIGKKEEGDGGIWGVFTVLPYPGLGVSGDGEEAQGKTLVSLAKEFNVKSFIYSSSFRAGPKYEEEMKLSYKAKVNIEKYCKELGEGEAGLPWTILRPGFFMENFEGTIGSIGVGVLKLGLGNDTEIGVIASEDIGNVAASVFNTHPKYIHKTLSLVSEFASFSDLETSHLKATGKALPSIPRPLAWLILKMNGGVKEVADQIELVHRERKKGQYPESEEEIRLANEAWKMMGYGEWKWKMKEQEKSGKEKGKGEQGGWNKLSIGKLLTGRL